ncbi:hypothetical protein E4T56_gene6670 [Termitomyces sp. T112]|nr:hypothetical protein E4T56_gene6670 [Termitomyces sp. T112]
MTVGPGTTSSTGTNRKVDYNAATSAVVILLTPTTVVMSKSPSPRASRRKDFDKEPNPFEQSFGAKPEPDRPPSRDRRSASPRPVLPPLASISSPADPSYAWYSAQTLRAGPLSPAMLAGPQPAPAPFDPASFRTGLTPRSGLTPRTGLTPLVPGPAFPPSPNTAAFMAIMNTQPANPTITPNTLNALNGALDAPQPYISASNAANTAANGLFLLSQAHQELEKRQQDAQRQAAAPARRAPKRAADPAPAPTRAPPKRSRANTRRRSVSQDDDIDDIGDDDDDNDDDEENSPHDARSRRTNGKKPETEEEKRRNFLERNRQAALKCRQRKKAWLAQLQAKVEYLTNENERLTSALVNSREEISRLSALVGGGAIVGASGPGVAGTAGPPVAMNVSLGPANGKASARGGYGY